MFVPNFVLLMAINCSSCLCRPIDLIGQPFDGRRRSQWGSKVEVTRVLCPGRRHRHVLNILFSLIFMIALKIVFVHALCLMFHCGFGNKTDTESAVEWNLLDDLQAIWVTLLCLLLKTWSYICSVSKHVRVQYSVVSCRLCHILSVRVWPVRGEVGAVMSGRRALPLAARKHKKEFILYPVLDDGNIRIGSWSSSAALYMVFGNNVVFVNWFLI